MLAEANEVLCTRIPPNMFVNCLYAIVEPDSGHTLPCRKRHDEEQLDELTARGVPLGLMPGMPYETTMYEKGQQ